LSHSNRKLYRKKGVKMINATRVVLMSKEILKTAETTKMYVHLMTKSIKNAPNRRPTEDISKDKSIFKKVGIFMAFIL
jgi:hypothetical protein